MVKLVVSNVQWYFVLAASLAVLVALLSQIGTLNILLSITLSYSLLMAHQHRIVRSDEPPVVWSWVPFLGSAIPFGSETLMYLKKCRVSFSIASVCCS
jgi:hypothetical protein